MWWWSATPRLDCRPDGTPRVKPASSCMAAATRGVARDMDPGAVKRAGSDRTSAVRARRMEFGHDADAPGRARQLVVDLLDSDAIAEDVRLVVSELVTNVVQHTAEGGELRLSDLRPTGPMRVEVLDHSSSVTAVHLVQRSI